MRGLRSRRVHVTEKSLKQWCPCASPKEKALFPVAKESAEYGRNGSMQVHLTESVHRLWSLGPTLSKLAARGCDIKTLSMKLVQKPGSANQ